MEPVSTEKRKRGGQPKPGSRRELVHGRLSAVQLRAFLTACEEIGMPPSRAVAVAVVRWTLAQADRSGT